ncbi:condensin-2 complex subunit H2 [Periophthalmus magnuspinnatus]|uniref:condensin-2 complex subunit H2 n=1 Tax=Periophthalmus magnuspinnatus TaxID=409849 RepID=UPI00145BBE5E|nr:condensin-2 complex subunit H2 [Periophthalmus magnuspinnatus]XP_055087766.1 condensin-2 complex subunit H2 [Periophthalmus magnuspinnatus]
MEFTENRFAHLLQPIRELTKNWEVDVASELNDYLEELDEMCITFDEGEIRLNFAEAALLIQGSACIYSKKVELLHSLVYQTLGYINDKNKKKNKQAAESQENNAEEAVHNYDEDDAVFSDFEINPSNNSQNEDLSTAVNDVPLPPECLIPQDTRAKHKLPLITLKGEVLYSQKDFRVITLIPENDTILLTSASAESREVMEENRHPAAEFRDEQPQHNDEALVCANATAADVNVDAAEDNFLPLDDGSMEVEEHIERHQAPSEGIMIRERRHAETIKPREEERPPEVNVWALHDPYAVLAEDKPFKSGKCYKVPEGLDDGGKRKRKHSSLIQDFDSWFRGIFDPPVHRLKNGPTFLDLNYIYLTTVKDKLKTKKRIYRKAGVMISDEELRQTLLQPEDTEKQRHGEDPADEHPEILGEYNDNSDNEHEGFPDDVPNEFGGGPDFISPDDQNDDLSYEQLVKLRVEQLVVNSRGYTQETALSRRVRKWEDQIKPELALQEERLAFDIHDYSNRIVNAFDNVGQRRPFSSIVSGLDNFEVCKYLLASLQLANDYTVEIDSLTGLEKSVDSMGLTLLSVHRATERFKNLQAST